MKSSTYLEILKRKNECIIKELSKTITHIFKDEELDETEKFTQFLDIVEQSLEKDSFLGSSSDFHNLCVECARKNREDISCRFLEKGLEKYPKSFDLLADYLQYGSEYGEAEKCKKCHESLMNIPKENWTWRAFYFLIEYLLEEREKGADYLGYKEELLDLADKFCRYIPDDENGYVVKASIYEKYNDKVSAIAVLEEAANNFAKAPKALLRLADGYFQQGRLKDALQAVKRCERDSIELQVGVNQGYLYYLDGICQVSLLLKDMEENSELDREAISCKTLPIYESFRIAKLSIGEDASNMLAELKFMIKMVEIKTKTEYPY